MVATRRQPSPAASSPPPTAPEQLSKAQQAALKKLQIVGTDALKGDPKAAQAAREQVQTYHYRGAVYAADANTPSSWIENQPKRYLKRGAEESEGGTAEEEENDDNGTPARRPTKRRRSMPQEGLHRKSAGAMKVATGDKPRSGRAGRQSLPAKGKAALVDDEDDEDDDNIVHTVSSGVNDRVARPQHRNRRRESSAERKERYSRRNNTVPTLAETQIMDRENQRRKEEARRNSYKVEALKPEDMLSLKDLMRARHVRLARAQKDLREKLREWNLAKELLDRKRREAGLTRSTFDAPRVPFKHTKPQQTIDLAGSDSGGDNYGDAEEISKQWEREQEQNRAHDKDQREIPETSPAEEQPTNLDSASLFNPHEEQSTKSDQTVFHKPYAEQALQEAYTAPGASRPSSPLPTIATGANTCPLQQTRGFLASVAPTIAFPDISTTESMSSHSTTDTTAFTSLPPDSALPTVSAGGNLLRWTIKRRTSVTPGAATDRAEYAIDVARLEGESKTARARRIKREKAVVESWSKINGAQIVEEDGRAGGARNE